MMAAAEGSAIMDDITSLRSHASLPSLLSFVFYGRAQIWLWESLGMPAWRPRVTWRMAGDRTTSPSLCTVPGVDIWMLSMSTDEPRSDLAPCSACTRRPLPVCVTESLQKKAEVELDNSNNWWYGSPLQAFKLQVEFGMSSKTLLKSCKASISDIMAWMKGAAPHAWHFGVRSAQQRCRFSIFKQVNDFPPTWKQPNGDLKWITTTNKEHYKETSATVHLINGSGISVGGFVMCGVFIPTTVTSTHLFQMDSFSHESRAGYKKQKILRRKSIIRTEWCF